MLQMFFHNTSHTQQPNLTCSMNMKWSTTKLNMTLQMLLSSGHALPFAELGVTVLHLPYLCHQYFKKQCSSTDMMM